ncbi:MAG TPA: formylmethanofuran dehydrogenase subunit A [Gemmatales bacterium]|nr:formylmethanofuran dehydrogenase subunit A [Gemmatales bacterium]
MRERLILRGGQVYDPANGVNGQTHDVYVHNGQIVAAFDQKLADKVIDIQGMVVMPGGVDMHCHIAGPAVNRVRRLLPGHVAQGQLLNSAILTGQKYAALGYTTAIEAAVAATAARQAHFEMQDTPNLDKGFLLLLGNHEQVLQTLTKNDANQLRDLVAALLHRTGAFGIKIVNPGCVANWQRHGGNPLGVDSIDTPLGSGTLTPRSILTQLADVAQALKLPHPIHVHANRLGVPGNIDITLQTLAALQGRRHHLTHVQFHAYGKDNGAITSAAKRLMDHINSHPETTCDVGQVMFGPAVTVTEDSPLEYLLWQLTGQRWVNLDVELESGCGMLPFEFKDKSTLHAWQWAIGLELFLLAIDPWRVVLSTDHPNGASFLAYPKIIALLMDANLRQEELKRLPETVREKTLLRELKREYSLNDITIITRAGPARILGLSHKGQLGIGADADITVYAPQQNREVMFSSPRFVFKAGQIIVEEGHLRSSMAGTTMACTTPLEATGERLLKQWFTEKGSYAYDQFGVTPRHREMLKPVTR